MTSEGHQPADRASDTASPARGDRPSSFGLFEAPEVPDEFATFTPSRHGGTSSPYSRFSETDQAAGGEQSHGDIEPLRIPDDPGYSQANSGFSGFPPDPVEAPTSSGVYVPAPAVMPIPNPAVPDEEVSSWSAYSQNQPPARPAQEEPQQSWASFSHTPPPPNAPPAAAPPAVEEPQPVVSWAAYTPAEEPAPTGVDQGWAAFTAPADQPVEQPAWSGFASAAPPAEDPSPAWGNNYAATPEPTPQFQEQPWSPLPTRQPEEPEQQSGWSAFTNLPPYEPTPAEAAPAPVPAEAPADQSWTSYEPPAETSPLHSEQRVPGATLEGSWPAFTAPHTTEPDGQWQEPQAAEKQPWSTPAAEPAAFAPVQPVEPERPAPVAQTSPPEQPTRASASVPVASRLSPPTEPVQPARSEPRVYGAARPAEISDEPGPAPIAAEPPVVPQQASAPVAESTGRPAVARASVSVGRITPTDAVQPPPAQSGVYGRPQSTVYGSPAAAAQAAAAQSAPADAPPANVYGGGGATGTLQGGGGLPAQSGPAPTGTQRGGGMPPYGDLLGPASAQVPQRQPTQLPNNLVPAQRGPGAAPAEPAQDRFGNFKPAEEPPAPVRSSKVLFIVIGACVLLLGIALGTLWVVGNVMAEKPATFGVGQCVKQDGTKAVAADCTEAGAFTVTEIVTEKSKCPDSTQPTIVQTNGILCLKPAATP
ncbi:hypothetical protein F4553_004492 [Allocatelliglobosispora scoriae]|uniref:Uncharacterized protein n=1 Tax=Allocatelliglobosispora scoriae TaxID=643052 RepID=A0A841BW14_9ACTN|nr:hypothetical protein [Allocatelliglobosispora scoriae]MBB5871113.1 hypothetical protein [Allocatelliglobosispora scoriae]